MKKVYILIALVLLLSCKGGSYAKAEDAQEAGTEFIRASLDGDYKKAEFYLYQDADETNQMLLEKQKKNYNQMSEEDKVNFKSASIRAIRIEPRNDSVVNYVYTNSYKPTDTTTIKIIRVNNEWLVDLKDIH